MPKKKKPRPKPRPYRVSAKLYELQQAPGLVEQFMRDLDKATIQ